MEGGGKGGVAVYGCYCRKDLTVNKIFPWIYRVSGKKKNKQNKQKKKTKG